MKNRISKCMAAFVKNSHFAKLHYTLSDFNNNSDYIKNKSKRCNFWCLYWVCIWYQKKSRFETGDFVTTSKYKNILQNDIFLNGQKNYMQQYLWTNSIENFNDN